MLDKEEVLERLCILATEVWEVEFKHKHAHDCFCKDNLHVTDFRFEEEIISFIENCVNSKLQENNND